MSLTELILPTCDFLLELQDPDLQETIDTLLRVYPRTILSPFQAGLVIKNLCALIRTVGTKWHSKARYLKLLQLCYIHHLFYLNEQIRKDALETVIETVFSSNLEVKQYGSYCLSGLIQFSLGESEIISIKVRL
jgi:hypothetical protein